MAVRKISKAVGLTQAVIGGSAIVFAFLLFYNVLGLQEIIGASETRIGLYLWVLIIFGLLSTISGLLLFYEQ